MNITLFTNFRRKLLDLHKKKIITFRILTLLINLTLFYSILQICFCISTSLLNIPYHKQVVLNFGAYSYDSKYRNSILLSLLISMPLFITINFTYVVNAKKVLEYFLTNILVLYFNSVLTSKSFGSWGFFIIWVLYSFIVVLISETICLNFERAREFSFGGMLDLGHREKQHLT